MSIILPPECRPLSASRYETVPTEPPLSRTRIMAAVQPTTSRGYGIAAAVLYPANPGAIQVCSCSRFTRLLLVQLIF
jgi:hypothetical protein